MRSNFAWINTSPDHLKRLTACEGQADINKPAFAVVNWPSFPPFFYDIVTAHTRQQRKKGKLKANDTRSHDTCRHRWLILWYLALLYHQRFPFIREKIVDQSMAARWFCLKFDLGDVTMSLDLIELNKQPTSISHSN